jgi:FkbM family methyltransferase
MNVEFANKEGFLHSVNEIFRQQVYLFRAKSSVPFIIDAGANIGLSIIYFKLLYPESSIVAYEPDPLVFELLQKNVSTVAFTRIDLRNVAAWVEDTTLTFYKEGSLAGSTEVDFSRKNDTCSVRAERLKNVIQSRQVDFLKLDIEGAENKVLFDIENELRNVDRLFFEYHCVPGTKQELGNLLNMIERSGFRYSINGTYGADHPFIRPKDYEFELQMNVSCYRPQ